MRLHIGSAAVSLKVQSRSSTSSPLWRPKGVEQRVPKDVRTDGVNHILESSGMQRICGICGMKTR